MPNLDAREPSGLERSDVRTRAKQALALVHGVAVPKAPVLELLDRILKLGIPSEEERERIRDAKLAEDEGTTPPSSPPLSD